MNYVTLYLNFRQHRLLLLLNWYSFIIPYTVLVFLQSTAHGQSLQLYTDQESQFLT